MGALTAVAVIAAPLIFGLYSVNVADGVDPDVYRSVGTTLARIFLIQILFYGLTGLANAFLNSRRRFFAAAWSPILPNLIIIAFLLSLPNPGSADWQLEEVLTDDRLRWTLGLGATVGIASMAIVLLPAMSRTGFRFRPNFDFRHPAVRKLLSLSFWTIGFVVANQVALLVVRNLAEPGSSDASAYINAFTFFVLPHGLLAVSIATTFQPEMSRSVARRDRAGFVDQASLGLRMTALFTIPAGVGIFVLRQPIIGALLQRGEFSADDADAAQRALAGLALGLGAFSIYMFLLRGFYAHKDTKTPFKINVVENAINIVLAFVLVDRYGVLGPRPRVCARLRDLVAVGDADPQLQGARVRRAAAAGEHRPDAARRGADGRGRLAGHPAGRRQRRPRRGRPDGRRRASSAPRCTSAC